MKSTAKYPRKGSKKRFASNYDNSDLQGIIDSSFQKEIRTIVNSGEEQARRVEERRKSRDKALV